MTKTGDEDKSSTSTVPLTIDVMSPYFVSASDYPGQVHVGKILRDENYADWASEMSNALFAKNKYGFVDGSIPIPEEGTNEFKYWKRCNAMIRGWFNSVMNKEIWSSVKFYDTSKEIWDDLAERFGKECAPRSYELKSALTHIRQDNSAVSAYYTRLRAVWDETQAATPLPKCKCGKCTCELSKLFQAIVEKERLYEFLMGLDDSYGAVRTHILTTKPTPSLSTAYHLVSEDEAQKNIAAARKTVVDASAFQTHVKRHDSKHGERDEPQKCTYCGKLYHTRETCYKLHGKPQKKKNENFRQNWNPKANGVGIEQDKETHVGPILIAWA